MKPRQHKINLGFSLVELMVAMTLGLMITGAIIAVLISSKVTYTDTSSLSRLQENARFAITFLAQDLRRSGFYGCVYSPAAVKNHVNVIATSGLNPASSLGIPGEAPLQIEGFENGTSAWAPANSAPPPIADSDAVAVRYLDMSTATIVRNDPTSSTLSTTRYDPLRIDAGHPFEIGDIAVIADCDSADVFQITGITSDGGSELIEHTTNKANASPANSGNGLSKAYGTNARLMKLVTNVYSIKTGVNGNPSLYRNSEEAVEGIENLQILYGVASVDAQDQRTKTVYLKSDSMASEDWRNIISVRLGILTAEESSDIDSQAHIVNGTSIAAKNDKRQRREFLATISLRNIRR